MPCFLVNLPVVKILSFCETDTNIIMEMSCTAYVVHMLRSNPLQSAWNPANLGQSRQRRRNQRITNSQLAGCQKFIRENISQFLYFSHMIYHKRKSYWCTCLQVCFQLPWVLSSKRCLGSCASRGSTGQTRPKVAAKKHFSFLKIFLQDGVLVGSRLGEEMFTSSTKMLKVRV